MTGGEIVSLLINIAVGVYFAWYYPRSVHGKLDRMPPLFATLNRILPPFGYVLILSGLAYGALRLSGLL